MCVYCFFGNTQNVNGCAEARATVLDPPTHFVYWLFQETNCTLAFINTTLGLFTKYIDGFQYFT